MFRESEEKEEAKQKQDGFVSKLISIAFLLFGTDMLLKGDRSVIECIISLVIGKKKFQHLIIILGSLFFILKIFVADIYSH